MSEEQNEVQGFGVYHPEAAGHTPYSDAMAAWRNQVRSMQDDGTLPPTQEGNELAEAQEQQEQEPTPSPEPEQDAQSARDEQANVQEGEHVEVLQEGAESPQEGDQSNSGRLNEKSVSDLQERQAAEDAQQEESQEVYDPAEHTAPEVLEYLKGVGEQEAERVLESEQAGKNRKGITSLSDDILAKARENDETGSGSKSA